MPKKKISPSVIKDSSRKNKIVWEWDKSSSKEHLVIHFFNCCKEESYAFYFARGSHEWIPCFYNVSFLELSGRGNINIGKKTRYEIL